jgi:hypothetical protein
LQIGNSDNSCVAAFEESSYFEADFGFGMPMLRKYCSNYDVKANAVRIFALVPVNQEFFRSDFRQHFMITTLLLLQPVASDKNAT